MKREQMKGEQMKGEQMNSTLPIDIIIYILSFMKDPPMKPRLLPSKFGRESITFMNQIKKGDIRYSILKGNIDPIICTKRRGYGSDIYESSVTIHYRNSMRGYSIRVRSEITNYKEGNVAQNEIEVMEYSGGFWHNKSRSYRTRICLKRGTNLLLKP